MDQRPTNGREAAGPPRLPSAVHPIQVLPPTTTLSTSISSFRGRAPTDVLASENFHQFSAREIWGHEDLGQKKIYSVHPRRIDGERSVRHAHLGCHRSRRIVFAKELRRNGSLYYGRGCPATGPRLCCSGLPASDFRQRRHCHCK